jgi:hypothetical protein
MRRRPRGGQIIAPSDLAPRNACSAGIQCTTFAGMNLRPLHRTLIEEEIWGELMDRLEGDAPP